MNTTDAVHRFGGDEDKTGFISRVRRAIGIGALGAVVAGATMIGAPAAGAVDIEPASSSQCASGQMCVWTSTSYLGTFKSRSTTGSLGSVVVAQSLWNRTGKAVRVYASTSGSGTSTCVASGAKQASTLVTAGYFQILSTTSC